MLSTEILRTLMVADPNSSELFPLSAASGLVIVANQCFVVADDENALGLFRLDDNAPVDLLPLFHGSLPVEHAQRKAAKADLESLTVLPSFAGFAHGALFAVGSGSRPNRERGALLALNANGDVRGPAQEVDLATVYLPLHDRFAQVNIEGIFVADGHLCLLQRGNRASPSNACVHFDALAFFQWLAGGRAPQPTAIENFDLGSIGGVPLSFTDAAARPGGGWLFSAVSEDTSDSYADGVCLGSAIGAVGPSGRLEAVHPLATPLKVEGIAAFADAAEVTVWMVTDADDRQVPASLLRTKW